MKIYEIAKLMNVTVPYIISIAQKNGKKWIRGKIGLWRQYTRN